MCETIVQVKEALIAKILSTAHRAQIIVASPAVPALEASGQYVQDTEGLYPMELYKDGDGTYLNVYRKVPV